MTTHKVGIFKFSKCNKEAQILCTKHLSFSCSSFQKLVLKKKLKTCTNVNRSFFTPTPIVSGPRLIDIYFFVYFFVCSFLCQQDTRKWLDRFAWNFQGWCGVTMGRPDYILGQFRETTWCRNMGAGFVVLRTTACFVLWMFSWLMFDAAGVFRISQCRHKVESLLSGPVDELLLPCDWIYLPIIGLYSNAINR